MLVDVREAASGKEGGEGEENSGSAGWQDVESWRPVQKASWQRGALWLLRCIQLCFDVNPRVLRSQRCYVYCQSDETTRPQCLGRGWVSMSRSTRAAGGQGCVTGVRPDTGAEPWR